MQNGRFGIHGGQYIPETLMNAVIELEKAYAFYKEDAGFQKELDDLISGAVLRFRDGTELTNLTSFSGLHAGSTQVHGEQVFKTWYFKRAVDIDQFESVEIDRAVYPIN